MANEAHRRVGEWEILHRIGSGSFSIVWKGRHCKTLQLAAIKEITTASLAPEISKCLDAELEAMRRMRHPNIVAFYELIKEPGRMFIVMELCKDGDLQAVIDKERCTETVVRKCMIQLVHGLKAMRASNIVHRDLKPANLLLSEGKVKIADFGFARKLPSQNLADTLCGSPLYMAPEVLQRKKYDAKADLWSVGVILYEMLVSQPPYQGQNYIQLIHNIETRPLKIPRSVADNVSRECLDLLIRLLQRDPHKRIDFENLFQHPFLKDANPDTATIEFQSKSARNDPSLPRVQEKDETNEDSEFSFSLDEDFVVINKLESHPLSPNSETNALLLRISDWVLGYLESISSLPKQFFMALLSVQILDHLQSKSEDPEIRIRLEGALSKAQDLSEAIGDNEETTPTIEIYNILHQDAIFCAQKGAADELCGQFDDSWALYSRSIDLMTFLVEGGKGVPLNPSVSLADHERERLRSLISKLEKRKERCAREAAV